MVYHVGSPAMFDGNMFLPDTGTPIWKIDRRRTRFAVWLPDPLTVATWMAKSLTMRSVVGCRPTSWTAASVAGIRSPVPPWPDGLNANKRAVFTRRDHRIITLAIWAFALTGPSRTGFAGFPGMTRA